MFASRLEALSDCVFAFAFTLLVLEFHPPAPNVPLAAYLSSLWPSVLAYSISFLLIGLVWANHHSMFVHIRRVDRPMLFLNTMLLADVAFMPFPTQLLSHKRFVCVLIFRPPRSFTDSCSRSGVSSSTASGSTGSGIAA
jgi:uncharacterized membrane protein